VSRLARPTRSRDGASRVSVNVTFRVARAQVIAAAAMRWQLPEGQTPEHRLSHAELAALVRNFCEDYGRLGFDSLVDRLGDDYMDAYRWADAEVSRLMPELTDPPERGRSVTLSEFLASRDG
jgi:hypothetical protein